MAKRKKSKSSAKKPKYESPEIEKAYKAQRKRIRDFLSSHRRMGYVWVKNPLPYIPTSKVIDEKSVNRLRKMTYEYLYSKAEYASEKTGGELVPAKYGRYERRMAGAEKRKSAVPKPKRVKPKGKPIQEWEEINEPDKEPLEWEELTKPNYPKETDVVINRVREAIDRIVPEGERPVTEGIQKILDEFDVNEIYTSNNRPLLREEVDEIFNRKDIVTKIFEEQLASEGADSFVRRLQDSASEIYDILQNALYTYKDYESYTFITRFATIIRGHSLSQAEAEALEDIQDERDEYDY